MESESPTGEPVGKVEVYRNTDSKAPTCRL